MAALKEVRKGKNFVVYSDGNNECILLKDVRFSYPNHGTAREQKDNDTGRVRVSWGGVAMLEKGKHDETKEALNKILADLLRKNEATVAKDKRCLKDGDDEDLGEVPAEYKGHWYVTYNEDAARSGAVRPAVRDEFGKLIVDPGKAHDAEYVARAIKSIDTKFYGGCYGSVLIRPWFFNGKAKDGKTYPKRLLAGYAGVQFLRDGKPFGTGRIDESAADWDTTSDDGGDGL